MAIMRMLAVGGWLIVGTALWWLTGDFRDALLSYGMVLGSIARTTGYNYSEEKAKRRAAVAGVFMNKMIGEVLPGFNLPKSDLKERIFRGFRW